MNMMSQKQQLLDRPVSLKLKRFFLSSRSNYDFLSFSHFSRAFVIFGDNWGNIRKGSSDQDSKDLGNE